MNVAIMASHLSVVAWVSSHMPCIMLILIETISFCVSVSRHVLLCAMYMSDKTWCSKGHARVPLLKCLSIITLCIKTKYINTWEIEDERPSKFIKPQILGWDLWEIEIIRDQLMMNKLSSSAFQNWFELIARLSIGCIIQLR